MNTTQIKRVQLTELKTTIGDDIAVGPTPAGLMLITRILLIARL